MGISAAKQCCDRIFCKNKVIPIAPGTITANGDKNRPRQQSVSDPTADDNGILPVLGEVVDYDRLAGHVQQQVKQRIAWDDPDQSGSTTTASIMPTCCKRGGVPEQPQNQSVATSTEKDDVVPATSTPPERAVWRAQDFETTQVVSAISPSVPWLIPPDSEPDNLQL